MDNRDLLRERQIRKNKIRNAFENISIVILFFVFVVSVLLGIWWEPFPFWKVVGTEIVLVILFRIFFR